jgi:hypothetical protein
LFCFAFYSFQKERKKPYTLNAWTALKRKKKIYEMAQTNKTRLKFCAEKYFKGL